MKTTFKHLGAKLSLCILCIHLAFSLGAAETNPVTTISPDSFTNSPAHHVHATREDGSVAYLTAWMLERLHFTHHPLDTDYSKLFFRQYLEMFDPQHIHFLQSDIAEFDHYSTNLNRMIIDRPGIADTSPAYEIFSRFLLRLEQRTAYADELLKAGKFDFTADDKIVTDRHEMPYPKDLDAAKQLWGERVRYEYLQEKIARIESDKKKTNSLAIKSPTAIAPGISETNGLSRVAISNATTNTSLTQSSSAPPKTMEQTITDTLLSRYHRNLRVFEDWDGGDVLQTFLTSLARIYDPHSEYLGPVAGDNFAQQMNLGFFGIGAELTLSDDGYDYCTIKRLMPGGPAIKDGRLKDLDRIVAVAQGEGEPVDVVGMSLTKVVQLIKGPKDTEVRLTVMHAGSPERQVINLIRDKIPLEDQAAKARLIELPDASGKMTRIGYIDLPSFYAPIALGDSSLPPEESHYTSVDVEKLLKKLEAEKVDGVILDLRRNGGGSLEEAIKLTGLFIKDGPVVQVKNSDPAATVTVYPDRDPSIIYDGPLIVMTSRFSASASEIVAGALQDYGRALIVGDISTHGKGTVQSVNPLQNVMIRGLPSDPGSLKVTRSKFYRASGASTQWKGVLPDIVLPSVLNHVKDIGEKSLDYALPWDTIDRTQFEPVNRTAPYISDLLTRSTERVATNQDFAYVREDIEQVIRRQADKTASLNENTVLKEVETEEARKAARDKERASRKPSGEIDYDITLKQVDLPGLPPPVGTTNSVTGINPTLKHPGLDTITNSLPLAGRSANAFTLPAAPPLTEPERADNARLKETENIMVDYLSLLARHNIAATANPSSTVPPPTP